MEIDLVSSQRAEQASAIPLNSLSWMRTGGSEGCLSGSHNILITLYIIYSLGELMKMQKILILVKYCKK